MTPVVVALLLTVIQLLPSLQFDGQPQIYMYTSYHLGYQFGEFAAVLHGQTPLVDYYPQYQLLLGYILAPIFYCIGLNVFTFSLVMVGLSLGCLLLMFDVFRRTTGSSWYALALYLPFLGLAFMQLDTDARPWHQHINPFTYFAIGPIRYVGPCLAVWRIALYLQKPTSRRFFMTSLSAGFVALNNLDFGLAALAGVFLAILFTDGPGILPPWRRIRQLFLRFLPGLLIPLVLFTAIGLARTGELPRLDKALLFQRTFVVSGFNMLPMPRFGLHTVIYLTFIGAIARGLFGTSLDRLRQGVLIQSGVSGFGVLMYYVGRSHPHTLVMVFPMWGFALMLLTWTCWEEWLYRIRSGDRRAWAAPLTLLLTIGYLVFAAELGHTPNIRAQLTRLALPAVVVDTDVRKPMSELIQRYAQPGESVMIVHPFYGHSLAEQTGVRNVYPFTGGDSLLLHCQLKIVLQCARKNRVQWLFETDRGFNPLVRVFFLSADERRFLGATLYDQRAGCLVWKLEIPAE